MHCEIMQSLSKWLSTSCSARMCSHHLLAGCFALRRYRSLPVVMLMLYLVFTMLTCRRLATPLHSHSFHTHDTHNVPLYEPASSAGRGVEILGSFFSPLAAAKSVASWLLQATLGAAGSSGTIGRMRGACLLLLRRVLSGCTAL